jgi:hypothetical protein
MFGQQLDTTGQGVQPQPLTQSPVGGTPPPQDQPTATTPPDHQFEPPRPAFDDGAFAGTDPTSASITPNDNATSGQPTATPAPAPPPADEPHVAQPGPAGTVTVDENQLLDIKQQALQQLSPLVGQLDQDPEEKFHTTMRIIQASDNHTLIRDAYDAAIQITDEKARAQALLDIVNEINYFTKQSEPTPPAPAEPAIPAY